MTAKENSPIGLIDIGSNSVRMVAYHARHRVPLPLYNEKHFCGLGAQLSETGTLDIDGKKKALDILKRYALMAERLGVSSLEILATAAMRDASDGAEFQAQVEAIFDAPIQLISGEEEARYAALGVTASFAAPSGIIADLGGGSMEIATLTKGALSNPFSTPLGVLRHPDSLEKLDEECDRYLEPLRGKHKILYAVGGSFRALAKMHMKRHDYPLDLLHGYKLHRKDIRHIAEEMSRLSIEEIGDFSGIPRRRAPAMAGAAHLLLRLMKQANCEKVIFSVSGIREGYLFDSLSESEQERDPLLASAGDLASLIGHHGNYAQELYEWGIPLFAQCPSEWERLRHTACLLSEIAWRIDPNFRGEWIYHRALQSSLKGMTHHERVMVSLALYHRHQNKWKEETGPLALIDERERLWAKAVGLSLRTASELTGGASDYLSDMTLEWEDKTLTLTLDQASQPLRSATLEKHLDGLGSTLKALSNFTI